MTYDSTPQPCPFSCNRRFHRCLCVSAFKTPNCLSLYAATLRVFAKKKERKSAINEFRFCIDTSQRSTAQHCHIDTPFCTIHKSHVTRNFAVPVPHSERIRRCTLLFLCTLDKCDYCYYYYPGQKIETGAHVKLQARACSRDRGPEPAGAWLSQFFWPGKYIIAVRVAYFVAYTHDWPHLHASMHLAQALQVSFADWWWRWRRNVSFFLSLSLFMSTSFLRLFSRAHYWVNKYILKNACELQRVVLYFKDLLYFVGLFALETSCPALHFVEVQVHLTSK